MAIPGMWEDIHVLQYGIHYGRALLEKPMLTGVRRQVHGCPVEQGLFKKKKGRGGEGSCREMAE